MCERNEMGRYPSCVSAVFDERGAEGYGMCGECTKTAKRIYDSHRATLQNILGALESGGLVEADGGHAGDWIREIKLAVS